MYWGELMRSMSLNAKDESMATQDEQKDEGHEVADP